MALHSCQDLAALAAAGSLGAGAFGAFGSLGLAVLRSRGTHVRGVQAWGAQALGVQAWGVGAFSSISAISHISSHSGQTTRARCSRSRAALSAASCAWLG